MHKRFTILMLVLTCCAGLVQAQPVNSQIKDVVMPSPNAASLGKFGDIPVSYYTGVPNIGIPIYTVKEGSVSLPVALSYHSSGKKVAETASWVGAGWSLQAGGMISRTVQGKADESCNGYFSIGSEIAVGPDTCIAGPHTNQDFSNGTKDPEPDIFSFSVGGYNGKFFIDADMTNDGIVNGKVILIPQQDVRITYEASAPSNCSNAYRLSKFTIITPDGTKYLFGNIDNSANNHGIEVMETDDVGFWYANGWYLRKISSPDDLFNITLNYAEERYRYNYRSNYAAAGLTTTGYPSSTTSGGYLQHVVDIMGWRISSIVSSTATVSFTAGANRSDILNDVSGYESKELDKIQVQSGSFCKVFDLTQTYYDDASAQKSGMYSDKTLKLLSVQEKSCDNTVSANPYTFEYYELAGNTGFLPNRFSSGIDHWGFYNGVTTNPTSTALNIPTTRVNYMFFSTPVNEVEGNSNRQSNEASMKLGTLKKIVYPTGGSTSFEYEANTYWGTRDSLNYSSLNTLDRYWPGGQCMIDATPASTFNITISSSTELNDLYYTWSKKRGPQFSPSCCSPTPFIEIRVYKVSDGSLVGSASTNTGCTDDNITTAEGKLATLFTSLPVGVALRFEMKGGNIASRFVLSKLTTTTLTGNFIAGGLRIKKITNFDGINSANDQVRSYTYNDNNIPTRSSAILYDMPIYGYIHQGCIGLCNRRTAGDCNTGGFLYINHFFFENSLVPLSSFEGYHIGYSAVREYFNGSASGEHNLYQYFNEPGLTPVKIPQEPIQPRITSGELFTKAIRNALSNDVAYEVYTAKSETLQTGQGVYLKFNTYRTGGYGSAITFWKPYQIKTRPFRYSTIESFKDGQTTTVTKEYNGTNHLMVTKESLTNSDGKVTETEYVYPAEVSGLPSGQLAEFNRLNIIIPLETRIKVAGVQQKGSKIEFASFDNASGNFVSTSGPSAGQFLRPYQFKNYEAGWVIKGSIDSYHGTSSVTGRAGLPLQFTKTGWLPETYEWYSTGLIKQRKFKDFLWKYEYFTNTPLVSKITGPDGQFSDFLYDPLMRLQESKARSSNVKTNYAYTYPTVNVSGIITSYGKIKSTTTYTAVGGSGLGTQESFQYFDGLGRVIETVAKGKANALDQVMAVSYDVQGRVSKTFELFASGVSDGSYQNPGATPYTLTEYEANSLNRTWKVTPPSWFATINGFSSNLTGDGVLNYNFSTGSTSSFAAGELSKSTVTDGNGNKTFQFTDKKGRMLLSRRTDAAESTGSRSDTYYVYDDKDRLVKVIPPGASWSDADLTFGYTYLNNDLISQKKIPGKAAELYEYNSRDLPIRFQDAFLQTNGRWMASKYDDYGRLTEKGVYAGGSGDAITLSNKIIENIYSTATSGIETDKLKTSKTMVLNVADPVVTPGAANGVLQSTFNYDSYGRVSSQTGNNHTALGSTTAESISYTYDFGDNILSETRSSTHSAGTTTIVNARQFDAWGRLSQTTQSVNGGSANTVSRLAYTAKDQLAWKKLGPGTNGLQQVDYNYLSNGLLSDINGTSDLSSSTYAVSNMLSSTAVPSFGATTDDLFREVLQYNSLTAGLNGTVQQSVNIGQMLWQVKGRGTQAYGFTYDHLDRLTNSRYSDYTSGGTISNNDYFTETQSFDARGNIQSINRKGMVSSGGAFTNTTIDNQTLIISSGTNKTTGSSGTTSIDPARVNMDAPHNFLNLPSKFDFGGNNTIELLYDATGNKLRKTVKTAGTVTLTQDYLGEIELNNNVVEAVYNEEGRAVNNAGTFRYEYTLKDHLGNTRLVFSDKNGSGSIDNSEIISETHYYPFGKVMNGAWYKDPVLPKFRYLYNGKELNEEFGLNFYDYGARWYDAGMGSWWEVDPLAESGRRWGPYTYGNNNPVRFVDPDGMESQAFGGVTSFDDMNSQHEAAQVEFANRDRDKDKKKSDNNKSSKDEPEKKEKEVFNGAGYVDKDGNTNLYPTMDVTMSMTQEARNIYNKEALIGSVSTLIPWGRVVKFIGAPMARWIIARSLVSSEAIASKAITSGVNRIYSARELIRRSAEPGPFHNFPESFNKVIFENGTKTVTPNYFNVAKSGLSNTNILYRYPGTVNQTPGFFEIGVRPSVSGKTEVIIHRFFNPIR